MTPKFIHGRNTTYQYGCRCSECKAAHKEYISTTTDAHGNLWRRGKIMPTESHGTTNGYSNWGCRCDTCKFAWRRYNSRLRAKYKALITEESYTEKTMGFTDEDIHTMTPGWNTGTEKNFTPDQKNWEQP